MVTSQASLLEDSLVHLPRVDATACAETLSHLMRLYDLEDPELDAGDGDDLDPGAPGHVETFTLIVPLIESVLVAEDEVPPALAAQLIRMAAFPAVAEALAMQIAFGRRVGEEHALSMARLLARAQQRGLSADDYVAAQSAAGELRLDRLARLLHGQARRTPSADRVRTGITVLRRVIALAPTPLRPQLLCAVAWLHWARGQRAIAVAYLAEASRIEPTNVLAYGLSVVFADHLPVWVRRPDAAA